MNDLINKLIAATAGNPDLVSWSETNLGERFTLFVGVDENNPPKAEHYPLIAITEIRITGGGTGQRVTYEIDMAAGIEDETVDYLEDKQAYIYRGIGRVDAFRARAFSALYLSNFGKISIKEGAAGQSAFHPLYISFMTVTIEYINHIRRT
jgi:hypothetical protein